MPEVSTNGKASKKLKKKKTLSGCGCNACSAATQGMTRAKRYANHAGGRKYEKGSGKELAKSSVHKDAKTKSEASLIFRGVWEKAKSDANYLEKKAIFLAEQKKWDRLKGGRK